MSLVIFLLAVWITPESHAAIAKCEKPLQEIELKMQVAADNIANASDPALPGMWPKAREKVDCRNAKCKVEFERGVRLAYEPFSFYADNLGLVGYPDIDPEIEHSTLASLQWEYGLQKEACKNSHLSSTSLK